MNEIVFAALWRDGLSLPAEPAWLLLGCVRGTVRAGGLQLSPGEVAVFPQDAWPREFSAAEEGCACVCVRALTLTVHEPMRLDAGDPHLCRALEAICWYFGQHTASAASLLAVYGQLVACHLQWALPARRSDAVVESIRGDILAHFASPTYHVDEFLRGLPFSYDYLRKLFQRETGVTPNQYLNGIRLEAAADALRQRRLSSRSVTDIAHLCGFRDPLYFSRMFRKRYGVSPSFFGLTPEDA